MTHLILEVIQFTLVPFDSLVEPLPHDREASAVRTLGGLSGITD